MTYPLYDVDTALGEVARMRGRQDPITLFAIENGDRLAAHLARHHPLEEREAVGRGLLVASASLGALIVAAETGELPPDGTRQAQITREDLTAAVLLNNVLGFAGERLARDGRAAFEGMPRT